MKNPSGDRSCSPIMLFTCMPVPGTTTPEPSPFVHVTEQAHPSVSITEMWVVDPSRPAMKRSRKPGASSPSRNAGVRSSCARSIAATISSTEGGGSERSSSASAYPSSVPPALGGGFVSTSRPR